MAMAGGIEAGRAFVALYLNKDALTRGLKAAQADLKAFGGALKNVGTPLMAAGAAIAGSFVAAAKSFVDFGATINDIANRTGASVEAISELKYAAEQSGTEIKDVEIALRQMQKAIAAAANDGGAAAERFARIGVSLADLAGKSPDEQLAILAEALSRIPDAGMRAAASLELFGKSGTNVLPMLADGAVGLQAMREEAQRLGLTLSAEDAEAAAVLDDTLNKLQQTLAAVWRTLGAALAPSLQELADWLLDAVPRFGDWLDHNRSLIITLAQLGTGAAALGAALYGIGTAATATAAAMGALGTVLTFVAAHPVVLTLAAVTAATVALGMAMSDAEEATAQFVSAADDALSAGDKSRQQDDSRLRRLEQLASKQRLTSAEMDEAKRIIAQLEEAYGSLGVSVSDATGAIVGMAGAQAKLNAEMRAAAEAEIAAAMDENMANLQAIVKELQNASHGSWFGMTPGMTAARSGELETRRASLEADNTQLAERMRRLREGDASAATGQPRPYVDGTKKDAEKSLRFQQDLEDELSAKRIANIDNEHRRAIAAIDEEYRLRERDIRENADLTEEQQAAALATIREMEASDRERARAAVMKDWGDLAKKRQEDAERTAERTAERQQELADELARAEIEATMKPGAEREKALLELERRKALADAAKEGQSLADVNRLYDLKAQAIQSGDTSRIATAGTFSAYQAASFGTGNPQLEIAKNTRENARIAAVSNKRLEGMERTLQRLADNKSVVVID